MTYPLLQGLRVVESSAFIAAPLAGLTLAQYGADVVRIDMIGGGLDYARLPRMPQGRSLYWTGLNKGKRSVAVDLRKPEGRELVQALVTAPGPGGGVLLTNIATAWLDHGLLAQRRPDLVSCIIQGNADGSTALDYTVNSAAGYPAITGDGSPDAPVNHALPAWDLACAYQAAFAVLAAVMQRRHTGQGALLKIALADVAFSTLSHLGLLAEAEVLQQDRKAIGNHIYGAFGRDFACADGRRLMVAAISLGQWDALLRTCDALPAVTELEASLGLDFRDEAQRYQARDAIAAVLEPWFAARPRAQAETLLERQGACWGRYSTVRELLHADARVSPANPMFETLDTPGVGAHLAAGATVRIAGEPRQPTPPAPLLGAHTDEVLHEVLGLDGGAIGRLHDAGIVAGPERDPTTQG
ncbi:2-methylfumaryl-CoA isomerase [Ramlibacter sp. G-1-2-2]|uniref:2-methylfumaryl-CoA isomerase n=1 Tax=Ramlibacter agri TaxID=2728837 RepID=A0A848H4A5_9BURK|nr:CoA transferase [Ramlibacter agri]NML44371.1 2-methylfumaryl-CoA isomerase [Ramlibacter agri]